MPSQQPPAAFSQLPQFAAPGYGQHPLRPAHAILPPPKWGSTLGIAGLGLFLGLISLFVPFVSTSNDNVPDWVHSLTLSEWNRLRDVAQANDESFSFNMLMFSAVVLVIAAIFTTLLLKRSKVISLVSAGGLIGSGAVMFLLWILFLGDMNELNELSSNIFNVGVGFVLYLSSLGCLIAAGILLLVFTLSATRQSEFFAPYFGNAPMGYGPASGYAGQNPRGYQTPYGQPGSQYGQPGSPYGQPGSPYGQPGPQYGQPGSPQFAQGQMPPGASWPVAADAAQPGVHAGASQRQVPAGEAGTTDFRPPSSTRSQSGTGTVAPQTGADRAPSSSDRAPSAGSAAAPLAPPNDGVARPPLPSHVEPSTDPLPPSAAASQPGVAYQPGTSYQPNSYARPDAPHQELSSEERPGSEGGAPRDAGESEADRA